MLNLNLEEFMVEFENGTIKNVGPTTKAATAKLFHPEDVRARAFGDSQVKIVATDEADNEIQIAMDPKQAAAIAEDIETMQEESRVFE